MTENFVDAACLKFQQDNPGKIISAIYIGRESLDELRALRNSIQSLRYSRPKGWEYYNVPMLVVDRVRYLDIT